MLLISPDDNVPLPKEYHNANNVCAYIYDQIMDLLTNEAYYPFFKRTSFNVEMTDVSATTELEAGGIDILGWLKNREMNQELNSILIKHITLSILSDLVNFIYESLKTAQKGKITVAYALLRKPFTDELLLLEQILTDPENFVERFFHQGDIKLYDPSSKKYPPNEREIIEKAFRRIGFVGITADLIYKIRYDKSYAAGINGISNQALHIVTNDSNYRTSNQNLNFVFSTPADQQRYWKHYYNFVPMLLIYAASIADEILLPFLPDNEMEIKITMRGIKRLLAVDKVIMEQNEESLTAMLSGMIGSECEKCGESSRIETADFNLFFATDIFLCPHCLDKMEYTTNSIQGFSYLYQLIKKGASTSSE